ncbi:MAG: T9SS C-terminal target domain-containing protein [Bacteroidetes bacterium]|nr:MAG: T9SS C-terminal target domain-containing protein [Bacteroidota bacterium]
MIFGAGLAVSSAQQQYCADQERLTEVEYFTEDAIEFIGDVAYGRAEDWEGRIQELAYDIFAPDPGVDPLAVRPAVVLMHGGSFRNGNRANWHNACREFAKRGFVAITLSYRVGWSGSVVSQLKASYRANQDVRAALRHIVHHAAQYGVDTNWIFLGGSSAGAINALNTVYVDQAEWNSVLPGLERELGGLNTSTNELTDLYDIKGVFNNWGSTLSQYMQPEEMRPMVSFHGELDTTVPIENGLGGMIGSRLLHERLLDNGICSELTVKPDAEHGFFRDAAGEAFRVARASCFFRSLLCDSCTDFYTTEPVAAHCVDVVATEEVEMEQFKFRVHPNPYTHEFRIQGGSADASFELVSLDGKLLHRGHVDESQALYALPVGIYLLRIHSDGQCQVLKLVKQ